MIWLPFPAGLEARCGQGPFGTGSHQGGYAYDLELPAGTAVLSATAGRVFQVVDDKTVEGTQQFYDSNRILVDLGGGRYLSYVHHRPGTARVRAGERVRVGQKLAEVGRSGTVVPHIHLDLRGPAWERTWPVLFRTASGERSLEAGDRARSVTRQGSAVFRDSRLEPEAFSAHGITLEKAPPAFLWRSEDQLTFEGRAEGAQVRFALWQDQQPSELLVSANVGERGRFVLKVELPTDLSGPRWYRLDVPGQRTSATVPVGILPKREPAGR